MKQTGLIRKLESLGRVVIASEIRNNWGWKEGDCIEVYVEKNKIIAEKNNTGVFRENLVTTRELDALGRIVIPKGIRKKFNLQTGDQIEILVDKNKLIIQKYEDDCIFCGSTKKLSDYKGKKVCNHCLHGLIEETA